MGSSTSRPVPEPPLDMPGAGEGPDREPKRRGDVDGAPDQHEHLAKREEVGGRDDEGLEDDAEAAGHDDGGAERGDEDAEQVAAVARRFFGGFGIHAVDFTLRDWPGWRPS